MGSIRRGLLIVAGVLSLTLGVIGIVVPLLPTTPLLLLAAACFTRSSDRLYQWLTTHRLFGTYIRNYREHKAVTFRTKAFTLLLLWAAIGYSTLFVVNSLILRIVLVSIAIAVTIHVLSLKTMSRVQSAECRVQNEDAGEKLDSNREKTGRD